MQRFVPLDLTPAASGWLPSSPAAPRPAWRPAQAVEARLRQAGIVWEPADPTAVARPLREVGRDLQGLLAIAAPARLPRQAPVPPAPATPPALVDAIDLLQRRQAEVRGWLNRASLRPGLQERGVTVAAVETRLQMQCDRVAKNLAVWAGNGMVVFPLVPSAHMLFSRALLDAIDAPPEPPTPAPADAATASTAPPAVDLAQQARALEVLGKFQHNCQRALPQLAQRNLYHLWSLMQGDVWFPTAALMASTFPCALTVNGSAETGYAATYPKVGAGERQVRRALLRGREALVAPGEKAGRVRISTDLRKWKTTDVYTDAVVEAAKAEVWRNVMAVGDTLYRHLVQRLW